MNTIIEQMLKAYNTQTLYDKKNAMKEVMQELVLCGLSRAGFFKKAAFYGGTALRIFYGLDRFSEDLDFSLITADEDFNLKEYFPTLEKEVKAYGLNVTIFEKEKRKDTKILSDFPKGNTKEHLLVFYADKDKASIHITAIFFIVCFLLNICYTTFL
jgi:predicted nucleotidyltransferase component of viral defense system